MATLQHALARGLEVVFQLEEGETLTEPLPSRDSRRAILAFEATEGGAGVLSRLISEPERSGASRASGARSDALGEYRRCRRGRRSGRCSRDQEGADCVKGCYRCLLSYYNQPDHELIDRTNVEVRRILLRLARSEVELQASAIEDSERPMACGLRALEVAAPDAAPLSLARLEFSASSGVAIWSRLRSSFAADG